MRLFISFFIIFLSTNISAHALGRDLVCSNCSITASAVPYSFTVPVVLSEPIFPTSCLGSITQTNPGLGINEYQTYEANLLEGDVQSCPLAIQIEEAKQNRLHSVNGFVNFSGHATYGLEIIADNGNIIAQNGGDDDIKAFAANGSIQLTKMSGRIDIKSANGGIKLTDCFGFIFKSESTNGNVEATRLKLYSKKTATIKTINGSIKLNSISARGLSKDGKKNIPVKVRIIAHTINGSVKDRRSLSEKHLSKEERKNAAVLVLRAENGDIVIR